ncbi:MAG: hypothetical protein EOP06_02780 [Proteobacteria bacterium]|nr:MAG: hypothetical protein EOP06_02780 [Pseudomonadota bacterium]
MVKKVSTESSVKVESLRNIGHHPVQFEHFYGTIPALPLDHSRKDLSMQGDFESLSKARQKKCIKIYSNMIEQVDSLSENIALESGEKASLNIYFDSSSDDYWLVNEGQYFYVGFTFDSDSSSLTEEDIRKLASVADRKLDRLTEILESGLEKLQEASGENYSLKLAQ